MSKDQIPEEERVDQVMPSTNGFETRGEAMQSVGGSLVQAIILSSAGKAQCITKNEYLNDYQ